MRQLARSCPQHRKSRRAKRSRRETRSQLSRGGAERREPLDTPTEFKEGDEFVLALEVYRVTGIKAGHDEYDAVLTAELIGDAPTLD
jgi:hypothetical protein